jgi:YHS domain-containing protein
MPAKKLAFLHHQILNNLLMKKILLLILTTLFVLNAFAQKETRVKHFNHQKGLGIQGYDPVAYFEQKKALKGSKQYAAIAEGITYYFTSASNKDLFIKDYKKYEPQYGGWCAYAMGANNDKIEIDPETFKIKDGKLYLFYHSVFNNTLPKWNDNEKDLKVKADKNWILIFK